MKHALGIFAAAGILAGCGGASQSTLTPSAGMSAIRALGAPLYHGVLPDRRRREIGYISNFYSGMILAFDFPSGKSRSGTIAGSDPQGMCTRTGRGTFWIVDSGSDTVDEYKAGGTTKLKSLTVTSGEPAECSIDKGSGDLAVSILGASDVLIFKGASGSGTEISDGLESTYSVGYDGSGNLFADGLTSTGDGFVELPAGSSTFHIVTGISGGGFPGDIQWDGTYVAVAADGFIGRYSISDYQATLEGEVMLPGGACTEFWIAKSKFVCPDAGDENATVYAYPKGGPPLYTWTGNFDLPIGAVVVEK